MRPPLTPLAILASVAFSALVYSQEKQYFPDGAFRKFDVVDEAEAVALTLKLFGEKPLMGIKEKGREIYRVTSVGAWLDASCVRVERTGEQTVIVCHFREEYRGDRRRWLKMRFGERRAKAKDLDEVNKLFAKAGIRELPMRDDDHFGFDGATWVFELLKGFGVR